jgi:hypothetical protein
MNINIDTNNKHILIDGDLVVKILSNSLTTDLNQTTPNINLGDNFIIYINESSDRVFFTFSNKIIKRNKIVLEVKYDLLIESNFKRVLFAKGNHNYTLSSSDCIFEIDNNGRIVIYINDSSSTFTLAYYSENVESFEFKSLSYVTDATFITENEYMPEFSIACFDDTNFTIPRPIRQGVPIVSTVPAAINENSNTADINFYNLGKGNYNKTIYFRIICNKIMETISPTELSSMKLKIYMPNGLDTVRNSIYNDMYLVSNDSTNNISIYRSSFNFYIQGNYDGVEYVDGYMYTDVYVPLTVQTIMPIEIDFTI